MKLLSWWPRANYTSGEDGNIHTEAWNTAEVQAPRKQTWEERRNSEVNNHGCNWCNHHFQVGRGTIIFHCKSHYFFRGWSCRRMVAVAMSKTTTCRPQIRCGISTTPRPQSPCLLEKWCHVPSWASWVRNRLYYYIRLYYRNVPMDQWMDYPMIQFFTMAVFVIPSIQWISVGLCSECCGHLGGPLTVRQHPTHWGLPWNPDGPNRNTKLWQLEQIGIQLTTVFQDAVEWSLHSTKATNISD